MKTKRWIYSGDRPSNGAKELAALPGFLRLRSNRMHKLKAGDVIVNWGTTPDLHVPCTVINDPKYVRAGTDKLQAFQAWQGKVNIPDFTTDLKVAQSWLDDGRTVVQRNKLTGHSGDGILIVGPKDPGTLTDAPLYTKYIFKDKEWRVHAVNGVVVDTQRKIKDPDRDVVTWKVRSHDNGFIFARNGITENAARNQIAIDAVLSLGLYFGAVDLVETDGVFAVLEVNTAPGLEGQTIQSYGEALHAV